MGVDVTDEMRRAVYDADCAAQGHLVDVSRAVGMVASPAAASMVMAVCGPDDNTLPHLFCRRCGKVWLVIDQPAPSYPEAVAELEQKTTDADLVRPSVVFDRTGASLVVDAPDLKA